MFVLIVIFGLIAAGVFLTGLVRGTKSAFSEIADEENAQPEGQGHYASTAFVAVVLSAISIAAAGIAPIFIYLGPILAIGTALGVGLAFLTEERRSVR